MTQAPKDTGTAVRARLLRVARERGEDFQLVLTRYVNERLLYRLAASPHGSRFVLKGAALFTVWTGEAIGRNRRSSRTRSGTRYATPIARPLEPRPTSRNAGGSYQPGVGARYVQPEGLATLWGWQEQISAYILAPAGCGSELQAGQTRPYPGAQRRGPPVAGRTGRKPGFSLRNSRFLQATGNRHIGAAILVRSR